MEEWPRSKAANIANLTIGANNGGETPEDVIAAISAEMDKPAHNGVPESITIRKNCGGCVEIEPGSELNKYLNSGYSLLTRDGKGFQEIKPAKPSTKKLLID